MRACVFASIFTILILVTLTNGKPSSNKDRYTPDDEGEELMEMRKILDGNRNNPDNYDEGSIAVRETLDDDEEVMEMRKILDGNRNNPDSYDEGSIAVRETLDDDEEVMEMRKILDGNRNNPDSYDEGSIAVRKTVDDDSSSFSAGDESLIPREFSGFAHLFQRRQSSGFTTSQRQFQQLMLQAHNQYRARHCVSPLTLDDGINRSAQNYAEYLARINRMVHSQTNGLGENLFTKWSSAPFKTISGTEATDVWFNENQYYNYSNPAFSMETGHFTQVVWKGSSKVGVGFAITSDGKTLYVVAQYSPPGNYQGQFAQNVLQPRC